MAGYNRIVIVGNLTRDPDFKQLTSGQNVCRLGLATNRQFKNRQTGSMVQEVCYIDVDVWGAQAESCKQYLQKGRPVLIEGRLKFDSWEDQNGQTRSKHSIVADRVVFLGSATAEDVEESDAPVMATRRSGATLSDAAGINPGPQSELERDLLSQIDKIKAKAKKPATKKDDLREGTPSTGELNFQDQAPFEDDLPF
jgi:single-strand DNA-binding protein